VFIHNEKYKLKMVVLKNQSAKILKAASKLKLN